VVITIPAYDWLTRLWMFHGGTVQVTVDYLLGFLGHNVKETVG